ncbi:hypothetical protein WL07_28260 [Burkholderia cepacia]|nr:hypothetical protein WL07_28260 [Burkholderia cepacia]
MEEELRLERERIIKAVIQEIKECIGVFGIAPEDIFPGHGLRKETQDLPRESKRVAKYFNPATGAIWTGVGREPKWIKGRDRAEFALPEFRRDDS